MALPTTKQQAEFETFEPGTYEATLTGINLLISTEYGTDLRYQAAEFIWDIDGEPFKDSRFTKVSLNERSKFYNRLAALAGGDFDDIDGWNVSPEATTGQPLDTYKKNQDTDEYERSGPEVLDGVVGVVRGITIRGENIIGKKCLLALKLKPNGYNAADAAAATAMPTKGTGKRKKAQPVGAPD